MKRTAITFGIAAAIFVAPSVAAAGIVTAQVKLQVTAQIVKPHVTAQVVNAQRVSAAVTAQRVSAQRASAYRISLIRMQSR